MSESTAFVKSARKKNPIHPTSPKPEITRLPPLSTSPVPVLEKKVTVVTSIAPVSPKGNVSNNSNENSVSPTFQQTETLPEIKKNTTKRFANTPHAAAHFDPDRNKEKGFFQIISDSIWDVDAEIKNEKKRKLSIERFEKASEELKKKKEIQESFDKLIQFDNYPMDLLYALRNDTSIGFSIITMSWDHPFTRTMRFYKLLNIMFLNLLFAAFVTVYIAGFCPPCAANNDCNSCLKADYRCQFCFDANSVMCYDTTNPQFYLKGGTCSATGTTLGCSSSSSFTPDQSGVYSNPTSSCESYYKSQPKSILISICLGLVSAIYCILLEQILSCCCVTKCVDNTTQWGKKWTDYVLSLGANISLYTAGLAILFAIIGIAMVVGTGKNLEVWFYSWCITFLSSEGYGIVLSWLIFNYLYKIEKKKAAEANDENNAKDSQIEYPFLSV